MNILVRPSDKPQGKPWQVCLDHLTVDFASEQEARRFAAILEARLRAPHPLPQEQRLAG
ncbi:MAG: hypothetical protein GAK43_01573 [Stenotrophomonas maltophilia]|nr:MAG: hypothetical protein GAK43_01573 [Stenotrophomonas maltophilia]